MSSSLSSTFLEKKKNVGSFDSWHVSHVLGVAIHYWRHRRVFALFLLCVLVYAEVGFDVWQTEQFTNNITGGGSSSSFGGLVFGWWFRCAMAAIHWRH
jgi:hypothetical protein